MMALFIQGFSQKITDNKFYSHKTYVYKLTLPQALEFFRKHTLDTKTDLLTNLYTNFYTDSVFYYDSLPKGYYLTLKAQNNNIAFSSFESPYFQVRSAGYNREVWIIVNDYLGNLVTDAEVTIKNKKYQYREDCGCYPVPPREVNDTVIITKGEYFSMKRLYANDAPRPSYRDSQIKYSRSGMAGLRILPGYVAFNQPKYHLLDTVKSKAFLVDEKGRPWKKKMKVRVVDSDNLNSSTPYRNLNPVSDGAYVWEFVIPDTFLIDKNYSVEYRTKNNTLLKREPFRVEDYTLAKVTYNARVKKDYFKKNDPVTMYLKATDANNLPLLDANYDLKIYLQNMTDFYGKTFFLPDSWFNEFYAKNQTLDVSGETEILLPDSMFGNAILNFRAYAHLSNLENESADFTMLFTYDANNENYTLEISGDSVKADFFFLSKPDNSKSATLISYYNYQEIEKKIVKLPYSEKLNYAATRYVLTDDKGKTLREIYTPEKINELMFVTGKRTHDSIYISLKNDLKLPVSYQLFKDKKKFKSGRSDALSYVTADESLDSYYVIYSFRWKNTDYTLEKSFHIQEKKLNVLIDQPEIIFPGARVPVSVKVTDYKNNPVENVNLTAWSVNAQFGDIPLPVLPYFGTNHFEILSPFTVQTEPIYYNGYNPISSRFIDLLKLRETPYYGLIYGEGGLGYAYDSINSEWAEFTPYVLRKQNLLQIYTVYLNNEPVYISGTTYKRPLSIKVKPGKYEMKIKVMDSYYTINDIELKKGLKSFICLNVDSAYNNRNFGYLNLENLSRYTEEEQEMLKKHMLVLNTGGNYYGMYIEQDSTVFYIDYAYQGSFYDEEFGNFGCIGPFRKGNINIVDTSKDTAYTIYFEPGYLYHITRDTNYFDQPVLYPNPLKNAYLSSSNASWDFYTKAVVCPKIVKKKDRPVSDKYHLEPYKYIVVKERHPLLKDHEMTGYYEKEKCKLEIRHNSGKEILWMGVFSQTTESSTFATFGHGIINKTPKPGKYDIYIVLKDSSYFLIRNHELYANGTNYIRYDSTDLKKYDKEITDNYEAIIIRLNKPPVKPFSSPPTIISNIRTTTSKTKDGKTMISGFYTDGYGNPIDNAVIFAEKAGFFKAGGVTNEEGYFEIYNVEPGVYMFKIRELYSGDCNAYNVNITKGINNQVFLKKPISEVPFLTIDANGCAISNNISYDFENELHSFLNADNAVLNSSYSWGYGAMADTTVVMLGMISQEIKAVPGVASNQLGNKEILGEEAIEALKNDENSNRIRKNFRDYGFWVPNLLTGKTGEAHFTVVYPDNITQWRTIIPAMNGNKQTGIGTFDTKAYKPLSASLGIPDYLVAGDSIFITGKILNYTGKSIKINTEFLIDGVSVYSGALSPENSAIEKKMISFSRPDTAKLTYKLDKGDGYIDGEERYLFVSFNGVKQVNSRLIRMKNDTVITIAPSPELFARKLYITNDPLDLVKQEILKVKEYEYGCNEQTASKIKAMLLEKKMVAHLGGEFKDEKELVKYIKLLEDRQNADGSWGWWEKGTSDIWLTIYITDALNRAVADGYRTKSHIKSGTWLKSKIDYLPDNRKLEALNMLASIPFPMEYGKYVNEFQRKRLSFQDSLQFIKFQQSIDSTVSIEPVLRRFVKDPDGIYWGEEFFDIKVNVLQTSMLAYQILKNAGGQEDKLEKTRSYFLNYKKKLNNTIEQATMVETFLADMLKESTLEKELTSNLTINGKVYGKDYPYLVRVQPGEPVKIEKKGSELKMFIQDEEIMKEPTGKDSLMKITSKIMLGGKQTDTLKAGEKASLVIEVIVYKPVEYAFLEIPIPAGCIYKENTSTRYETYRKQYKHKTVIACDNLPEGKHRFTVEFVPRFEGKLHLLPAVLQQMYYPDICSYSKGKVVVVK